MAVRFSSGSIKPGHADRPMEKIAPGFYLVIGQNGNKQYQFRGTISIDLEKYPEVVEYILSELKNGEFITPIIRRLILMGARAMQKSSEQNPISTIDQQLFFPVGMPVLEVEDETRESVPENWQPPDVSLEI